MAELDELLKDIEILRDNLQELIKKKAENLTDPDVMAASKILNAALNQYNKFLRDKIEEK